MNNQTPLFRDYIRGEKSDSTSATAGASTTKNGISANADDTNNTNNNYGNNNTNMRCIIMEYLPGEDMHQLRDRHSQVCAKKASTNVNHKRLKICDAVYLCADVILPLLKSMHDCGMIHRDVKPSNLVRNGVDGSDKSFKLVDFGLSKSFIVPKNSSDADGRNVWKGVWDAPRDTNSNSNNNTSNDSTNSNANTAPVGCMRKERTSAEFRGTSMYASLRVHQGYDHCRRDDIWGLMYVFCDLVSGGLPWFGYATTNRDRSMCQKIKEWVHGEREAIDDDDNNNNDSTNKSNNNNGSSSTNDKGTDGGNCTTNDRINNNNHEKEGNNNNDKNENNITITTTTKTSKTSSERVEELLKGVDHHLNNFERIKKQKQNNIKDMPQIIAPLSMSKDHVKINALRKAFQHLSKLQFADRPDYDLIRDCLREFTVVDHETRGVRTEDNLVPPIDWKQPTQQEIGKRKWERIGNLNRDRDRDRAIMNMNGDVKSTFPQALTFNDTDDLDPIIDSTLNEAENRNQLTIAQQENASGSSGTGGGDPLSNDNFLSMDSPHYNEIQDLKRLPLQLQFHLAQVEYNALNPTTIPIHLAFRDWMKLASCLVYDEWDTKKYERGNHRSNGDGYKRQVLMRIAQQCLDAARPFNNFCNRDCFYYGMDGADSGEDQANGCSRGRKRRKIFANTDDDILGQSDSAGDANANDRSLLEFSKVLCLLKVLIANERELLTAPPPVLSFTGDGNNM